VAAEFFLLAVFPLLLAVAAGWDLASFTIPNAISVALVAAFVVFAIVLRMNPETIGIHFLAGFIALVTGFTLFALGYIGGADAKLFAGAALWIGLSDLFSYALFAAVSGGALALLLIGARKLPLPAFMMREAWIARLHDAKSGIPYGVALAAGAIVILPHTEIFRLALSQ